MIGAQGKYMRKTIQAATPFDNRLSKGPLPGTFFMIGLPGPDLDPSILSLMQEYGVGNFIIFGRNIKGGPAGLRRLCTDIRDACLKNGLPDPFIAVDQEGGAVQRLAPPQWPPLVSNKEAGSSRSPEKAVRTQARIAAKTLIRTGINLNLAPVLDVSGPHTDSVLKDRCYGNDPGQIASLGAQYIEELQRWGIGATAKHFPGIGRVGKDPHKRRPVVEADLETILEEMEPFRRANLVDVTAMMTSHVIYTALDSTGPATFSKRIATGLLRKEIGFPGILVTDDLEMGGVTRYGSMEEAAIKAFVAGHDIVLLCNTPGKTKKCLQVFAEAMRNGRIDAHRLNESAKRILSVKTRLGLRRDSNP